MQNKLLNQPNVISSWLNPICLKLYVAPCRSATAVWPAWDFSHLVWRCTCVSQSPMCCCMRRCVSTEPTPIKLCCVSCFIHRKIMCSLGSCAELCPCTRFILGVMELNCHFTLRVGRMYLSLKSLSFSCTAKVQEYKPGHTSSLKFVFFRKCNEWSPSFIHLRGTDWKCLNKSYFFQMVNENGF